VEAIDCIFGPRPEANMRSGLVGNSWHTGAKVQPEFGIAFAKPHACFGGNDLYEAQWLQHGSIEGGAALEIADAKRDVIDHLPNL
jgi:hypothetical protein